MLFRSKHPGISTSDDWAVTGEWRTRAAYARQREDHPGMAFVGQDMEAARARALSRLLDDGRSQSPMVQLDPNSKADVHVTVHVDASPELQAHIAGAEAASSGNLAAHVGAMGTEAAPRRVGGIGLFGEYSR